MDDNAVESLEFHQDTVASDSNSPLHLIREKEIEISGRMLAAKREADEIVAQARKDAAALLNSAKEDASALATAHDEKVRVEAESEIVKVREETDGDVAALEDLIGQRRAKAVDYIVKAVTEA